MLSEGICVYAATLCRNFLLLLHQPHLPTPGRPRLLESSSTLNGTASKQGIIFPNKNLCYKIGFCLFWSSHCMPGFAYGTLFWRSLSCLWTLRKQCGILKLCTLRQFWVCCMCCFSGSSSSIHVMLVISVYIYIFFCQPCVVLLYICSVPLSWQCVWTTLRNGRQCHKR